MRFQSRSALAREFLLIKKGENFYSAPTTLNKQVTRAVVVVVVVVLDFMLTDRAGIIRGGSSLQFRNAASLISNDLNLQLIGLIKIEKKYPRNQVRVSVESI